MKAGHYIRRGRSREQEEAPTETEPTQRPEIDDVCVASRAPTEIKPTSPPACWQLAWQQRPVACRNASCLQVDDNKAPVNGASWLPELGLGANAQREGPMNEINRGAKATGVRGQLDSSK